MDLARAEADTACKGPIRGMSTGHGHRRTLLTRRLRYVCNGPDILDGMGLSRCAQWNAELHEGSVCPA